MRVARPKKPKPSLFESVLVALTYGVMLSVVISLQGCCSCTAALCYGGLELTIVNEDGSPLDIGAYRIAWEVDGITGEISEEVVNDEQMELSIIIMGDESEESGSGSADLDNADEIGIAVFVDEVEVLQQIYELVHGKEVCNECSGGPWCDDDTFVTTEPITIEMN